MVAYFRKELAQATDELKAAKEQAKEAKRQAQLECEEMEDECAAKIRQITMLLHEKDVEVCLSKT